MSNEAITLQFLGKAFRIACPSEEKQSLLAAAELLSLKMEEVRKEGGIVGLEKIAVLAALNLTHELNKAGSSHSMQSQLIDSHLDDLNARLDQVLNNSVE